MKASSVEEFEDDAKQIVNRRALKPGEWACVDAKCAHINIEKRTSCDVCGKSLLELNLNIFNQVNQKPKVGLDVKLVKTRQKSPKVYLLLKIGSVQSWFFIFGIFFF